MTVNNIMTREVITVEKSTSVSEMRILFQRRKLHHLLVVDEGRLVGVLSDRDVLAALSPFVDTFAEEHRDIHTLGIQAHELIRRAPVTIDENASIEEAASLLLDESVSCLPVLSPAGEIKGIVTSRDILRHMAARRPGER